MNCRSEDSQAMLKPRELWAAYERLTKERDLLRLERNVLQKICAERSDRIAECDDMTTRLRAENDRLKGIIEFMEDAQRHEHAERDALRLALNSIRCEHCSEARAAVARKMMEGD